MIETSTEGSEQCQAEYKTICDSKETVSIDTKVVNSREVREVQEGATCFCAKKLSKFDKG